MDIIEKIKRAFISFLADVNLILDSINKLDITIVNQESDVPSKLLSKHKKTTIIYKLSSKDNLNNPFIIEKEIGEIIDDFGLYPWKTKIFAVIQPTKDTQKDEIEHKAKIFIFPKKEI